MAIRGLKVIRRLGLVTHSLPNATSHTRGALFHGDVPVSHHAQTIGVLDGPGRAHGGGPVNFVCSVDYLDPRPISTLHRNVTYTPTGYAWVKRKLDVSLSARPPRLLSELLLDHVRGTPSEIDTATIVQSQHPNTYGDWTSEHVKSIAHFPDFPRPLALPADIAGRPYVRHELKQLGIDTIAVDRPLKIRNATVIHLPHPYLLWTTEDVAAYRRLFAINPPAPRAGSLIYLSRSGVKSEQRQADRQFPSEAIARIVADLGGKTIVTEGMKREDFALLADEAETVIADHGAALFNMLQWNTRHLIELVTDNWWSKCFVFLATSCGVANHAIVRTDGRGEADLRAVLTHHLAAFRG
jgi:hypothetical protein